MFEGLSGWRNEYTLIFGISEEGQCTQDILVPVVLPGIHTPPTIAAGQPIRILEGFLRIYFISRFSSEIPWIQNLVGGSLPPVPSGKSWAIVELEKPVVQGDIVVIFDDYLHNVFLEEGDEDEICRGVESRTFGDGQYMVPSDLQCLGESLACSLEPLATSQMFMSLENFRNPHKILFNVCRQMVLPNHIELLRDDLLKTNTMRTKITIGRHRKTNLLSIFMAIFSILFLSVLQGYDGFFRNSAVLIVSFHFLLYLLALLSLSYVFADVAAFQLCKRNANRRSGHSEVTYLRVRNFLTLGLTILGIAPFFPILFKKIWAWHSLPFFLRVREIIHNLHEFLLGILRELV